MDINLCSYRNDEVMVCVVIYYLFQTIPPKSVYVFCDMFCAKHKYIHIIKNILHISELSL